MAAVPATGERAEHRCLIEDTRVAESSGVAAASWSDDVVFTHNDSGDSARFFSIDARTCATRATFTVRGASNDDWEDMARGTGADGSPVLWLADIGDNREGRSSVVVYEVAEPGASSNGGAVPVRSRWRLTYPDGAHDAETLLTDPETGRPVVMTKEGSEGRTRAYRVPPSGSGVLELLATVDVRALPGGALSSAARSVTGGATSPDRRAVALRSYLAAWRWTAAPGEPLAAVLARPPVPLDLPVGRQAEAISFTRDGTGLWATSEGEGAPLHLIPLTPTAAAPGPAAAPSQAPPAVPLPAPTAPPSAPERSPVVPIVLGAGTVVLAGAFVTVVGVRSWRRRR